MDNLQTPPIDFSRTGPYFPRPQQAVFVADLTPSPTDITPRISFTDSQQMSVDCSYEEPTIITPPKPEWHYRSTRDLAKKHIPFISGDGPQRTPIRIKVNILFFSRKFSSVEYDFIYRFLHNLINRCILV